MNDNVFWLATCSILGAVFILIVLVLVTGVYYTRRVMVENGYEEVIVIGRITPCWQKVKEESN